MELIVLQGRLVSADVWISEPEIGAVVIASKISVPDELETRGIYAAEISIFSGENRIEFAGDVVVEPAQTNAIGQRRERSLAFTTTLACSPQVLDGAEIELTILPTKKDASESLDRFKVSLGEWRAQQQARLGRIVLPR
jgi:hypothetical protein